MGYTWISFPKYGLDLDPSGQNLRLFTSSFLGDVTRIAGTSGDCHMWVWMGGWTSSAHIPAIVWCEDHSGWFLAAKHLEWWLSHLWTYWKYMELWTVCGNMMKKQWTYVEFGKHVEEMTWQTIASIYLQVLLRNMENIMMQQWISLPYCHSDWDGIGTLGVSPKKIRPSNVGLVGNRCISGVASSEPMSSWHINLDPVGCSMLLTKDDLYKKSIKYLIKTDSSSTTTSTYLSDPILFGLCCSFLGVGVMVTVTVPFYSSITPQRTSRLNHALTTWNQKIARCFFQLFFDHVWVFFGYLAADQNPGTYPTSK